MIKVTEMTGELREWTPWKTYYGSVSQPWKKAAKPSGTSRRRTFYVGRLYVASILEFRCDSNFDCACCGVSFYRVTQPGIDLLDVYIRHPTFEQALKQLQELVG